MDPVDVDLSSSSPETVTFRAGPDPRAAVYAELTRDPACPMETWEELKRLLHDALGFARRSVVRKMVVEFAPGDVRVDAEHGWGTHSVIVTAYAIDPVDKTVAEIVGLWPAPDSTPDVTRFTRPANRRDERWRVVIVDAS